MRRPILSRRRTLGMLAGAPVLAADGARAKRRRARPESLGVALGGGGAKGLAHLSVLQAIDESGVKVSRLAGTSSGALIAALYAGGRSAAQLRRLIDERFALGKSRAPSSVWERYMPRELLRVAELFETAEGEGGMLRAERFLDVMLSIIDARTFEELTIPLAVVAADYWSREPVVLDKGPLKPAILASMALPGVFVPETIDGRVLVDGGLVNPVPFDLLHGEVDRVLAVDVIGTKTAPRPGAPPPSAMDSVFQSFQIMEKAIVAEKKRRAPPDIYIEPPLHDVAVLEFYRAHEIYAQADPQRAGIRAKVRAAMGLPARGP